VSCSKYTIIVRKRKRRSYLLTKYLSKLLLLTSCFTMIEFRDVKKCFGIGTTHWKHAIDLIASYRFPRRMILELTYAVYNQLGLLELENATSRSCATAFCLLKLVPYWWRLMTYVSLQEPVQVLFVLLYFHTIRVFSIHWIDKLP
jgi:hypothetical protein